MSSPEKYLWVESYRPKTVNECILPKGQKSIFQEMVDNNEIGNLILTGISGVGKTTVARALCSELNIDHMFINASESSGIDTLRTTVRDYASSVSMFDDSSYKVVIVDEADGMSQQSFLAWRGMIEEFHNTTRFIFTCNHLNRIPDALHSRCMIVKFDIPKDEEASIKKQLVNRVFDILNTESIDYDKDAVLAICRNFYPDYRRILNTLQNYSRSGRIDKDCVNTLDVTKINEVIGYIKEKDFGKMQQWVKQNTGNEMTELFRAFYDRMKELVEQKSIPSLIVILRQAMNEQATTADVEIMTIGVLLEIMMEVKFK